ncbi:MAG: MCE family protein [Spirochaetaceae bacterium]|nr:MAG: MCE family protein [Spirochaetaceae bacterium]
MKFRIRFVNQVVGVFLIVALGFLFAILISIGSNQRWFARNYRYYSVFSSAAGVSVGLPITFRGFQVGRVTAVRLTEDNEVHVDFFIQDTFYDRVWEHSLIQLVSNPLGIGGGLVFHQGMFPSDPIPEGSLIPTITSAQGRELVRSNLVRLPDQDDTINQLIDQVGPIMRNVEEITEILTVVLADIAATMQGTGEGPIQDMVNQTNRLLREAETVMVNASTISDNVAAITEEFRDPTGIVPRLLDPSGSIATFLDDDDALFLQIEAILEGMNRSINEVADFATFVNAQSPELLFMLEEGREALSVGQDVLEGLRNNPLLRGGIPERREQPSTTRSFRDDTF